MDAVPKSHNWVKARAECSVEHLFHLLTEIIDADVKAIEGRHTNVRFTFTKPAEGKIAVAAVRDTDGVITHEIVIFERWAGRITAKAGHTNKYLFSATPAFLPNGECKLEIADEALELWQVSRRGLEGLFFPPE